MQEKVILISDDNDFFEYLIPKLRLRESDNLLTFGFDDLLENIHCTLNSLLIVNCENSKTHTLELLKIVTDSPTLVFAYDNDEQFKVEGYKNGMFGYFTLSTSTEEINAFLVSAFKIIASQEKSNLYRNMLTKNNILMKHNEVFLDYNSVLEEQTEILKNTSGNAVLVALSPNDKSKFLIHSNQIETILLNNIRKNDILMNYAPNKYLLLLKNTSISDAEILWSKIRQKLPEGIFAGFTSFLNKNKESAMNDALCMLQNAINKNEKYDSSKINLFKNDKNANFKTLKQEFNKKIEHIVHPTFFKFQQIYNNKIFDAKIEQNFGSNYWDFNLISDNLTGKFHITNPGYFAVNIDISYSKYNESEEKRITLEQNELEEGLLTDIMEQFVNEFKNLNSKGVNNDNS